jgi:hypothetical protein
MTTKANHSIQLRNSSSPLVLFGIDSRGKPKAARFGKNAATLALKAASQLQLRTIAGDDPKIAEIAARLPVGRVHATGKAFVPLVRRDLYDKLIAAAGNGNGSSIATGSHAGGAATANPPNGNPNLPRSWDQIELGDLVVAQEQDPADGWYEAIVVEAPRADTTRVAPHQTQPRPISYTAAPTDQTVLPCHQSSQRERGGTV